MEEMNVEQDAPAPLGIGDFGQTTVVNFGGPVTLFVSSGYVSDFESHALIFQTPPPDWVPTPRGEPLKEWKEHQRVDKMTRSVIIMFRDPRSALLTLEAMTEAILKMNGLPIKK